MQAYWDTVTQAYSDTVTQASLDHRQAPETVLR
jgi:hypothetical protein